MKKVHQKLSNHPINPNGCPKRCTEGSIQILGRSFRTSTKKPAATFETYIPYKAQRTGLKWMVKLTISIHFLYKFGIIQLKQPCVNGCLGFQVYTVLTVFRKYHVIVIEPQDVGSKCVLAREIWIDLHKSPIKKDMIGWIYPSWIALLTNHTCKCILQSTSPTSQNRMNFWVCSDLFKSS